jgi:hypothetical protein
MEDIRGWGAIAWYEWNNPVQTAPILKLCRFNMLDLSVAKIESDNTFVFASTKSSIELAARMARVGKLLFYDIKEYFVYNFGLSRENGLPMIFESNEPLTFGARYTATNTASGGEYRGLTDTEFWSGIRRGTTTDRKKTTGPTVYTVGDRARVANICAFGQCRTYVNRRKALLCPSHLEQCVRDVARRIGLGTEVTNG